MFLHVRRDACAEEGRCGLSFYLEICQVGWSATQSRTNFPDGFEMKKIVNVFFGHFRLQEVASDAILVYFPSAGIR